MSQDAPMAALSKSMRSLVLVGSSWLRWRPDLPHNPKVTGSNPAPATTKYSKSKGPTTVGPFGVFADYEGFRLFCARRRAEREYGSNRNSRGFGRFRDRPPIASAERDFIDPVGRRKDVGDAGLQGRIGLIGSWVFSPKVNDDVSGHGKCLARVCSALGASSRLP